MRQMGKRIFSIWKNGKRVEMDENEFVAYQKDAASSAVKPGKKLRKFGYSPDEQKQNGSNVRVNQPTPTYGQANNQQDLDKQRQMLQEIVSLSGALERIQGQVQSQGILTPEQVNALIIPLKQQIMGLADKMVLQSDYRLQPNRWQAPVQPKQEPGQENGAKPFGGKETPEEEAAEEEHEEGQEGEEQQENKKPPFGQPQTQQKPGEQKPQEQKQPFGQKPNEQRPATNQQTQKPAVNSADAQRPQVEQTNEQKPVADTVAAEDDYVRQAREIDPKGFYDPQQLAEILRRLAEESRKRPQPQAGPKSKVGNPERDLENPTSTFQR